jgi:hypothetical protein
MSILSRVDFEQAYSIGDDDSLQKQGQHITLLEESFEGNDIPESWEIVENSVGGHLVLTAGIITDSETEAGRAYIHTNLYW